MPTDIISFFGDLEKAIKCPMLPPPIDLSDMEVKGAKGDEVYGVGYSAGQREDLATIIQDLREEIGCDISEGASGWSEFYLKDMIKLCVGSSIPANVQDFNDSMGMVLSALDAGLDDKLPMKGVTPSSWFRLSTALLAAMTRGLAAVESYQQSTSDEETVHNIIMEDMANQLINKLKDNPTAQEQVEKAVRERMMKKLKAECIEDIDEWRMVYQKGLVAALRSKATGTDIPILTHSQIIHKCSEEIQAQVDKKAADIKDSIIKEEVEKYLLLQETNNAKAIIQRKYLENIEEARREVRAEIASEKKNWVVAYRDSVQLTFLTDKAAHLGYHLVCNDVDEESEDVTPHSIPVTPVTRPRKLDGSIAPVARAKWKKGRGLIIPKPLSVAGSEASEESMDEDPIPPPIFMVALSSSPAPAPILPISVPLNVRASQQPEGPLREPITVPDHRTFQAPQEVHDTLRGVRSSMHNPNSIMVDNANTTPPPVMVTPSLPVLPSIPLMPGLTELLNALQTNISNIFANQISSLTTCLDVQDIHINSITANNPSKGKGKATLGQGAMTRSLPNTIPTLSAPAALAKDAQASVNPQELATPAASANDVLSHPSANPSPGEPMGPPVEPP
ncbi:hypothetical protein BJY52DRAFT_1190498 [Lactarius psammicola]|nr:hypothetical protein BJY52DRAFT_1190498 [Lactarius psammicola]